MEYELDCGDNLCLFVMPEKRTGMRTNGGCHCLDKLGLTRQQERPIRMWAINAPREWKKQGTLASESRLAEIVAAGERMKAYVPGGSIGGKEVEAWDRAVQNSRAALGEGE